MHRIRTLSVCSSLWVPFLSALFSLFLLSGWNGYCADATLTWNPNTEPDLAGYRVYYGNATRNYTSMVDVAHQTTCILSGLEEGRTYYVAATAYDVSGNESDLSEEISFQVPYANRAPVAGDLDLTAVENTTVMGTLRATDPDGDPLNYRLVDPPSLGQATVTDTGTGTFTYTPDPGVIGRDSFTFKADDGEMDSNLAIVSVTITPADSDGDGITDDEEIDTYGTDPDKADTDGDGVSDGQELTEWGERWNLDDDGDGIINLLDPDPEGPPPGQVNLAWHANTEADLAGYRIYYGTSSGNYDSVVDVGNWTSCVIGGLEEGQTYYFAATAYDRCGNESDFSQEVSFQVVDPEGDTDRDGIPDADETDLYGTDPEGFDTDGDAIGDGTELAFWQGEWQADYDQDGIINLLDPDADGDGFSDGLELRWGFDPADPGSRPELPPLAIGRVDIDHNWKRVDLAENFLDPVVIAKPLSFNGTDPAVLRIRNIDTRGFEIRIQEWDYLDGPHTTERVSYLVMERGSYTLADGTRLEAGRFETSKTGSFEKIAFTRSFQVVPVVVTAVSTFDEADTVAGRVRDVTLQGFEFSMEEQEINPQVHGVETVSYIAWEPCCLTAEGLALEVNRTDDTVRHNFYPIRFDQVFKEEPFFLADMQTADGGDSANLRWRNLDLSGVEVQVDEEQSRDRETSHTTEVVGYILLATADPRQ
ncbi:MAG: cadherin-like domain-containing protein [Deltaproteobacteria bacterium]|nr:cadherin-like domain-containing protein [Deltaproteobacteria bacterium]